jgi:chaperonin cofactor prefoldin
VDRRGDLEAEREELSRRLERTENELAESKAAERDLRRRITQAQSAVRSAEKDTRAARER